MHTSSVHRVSPFHFKILLLINKKIEKEEEILESLKMSFTALKIV